MILIISITVWGVNLDVKESELEEIENAIEEYKDSDEATLYPLIYDYYPKSEGGGYEKKNFGELSGGFLDDHGKVIDSFKDKFLYGMKIFESKEKSLYQTICCRHNVASDIGDVKELALLILPLLPIATATTLAVVFAIILLKIGLPRFCDHCNSKYGTCTD